MGNKIEVEKKENNIILPVSTSMIYIIGNKIGAEEIEKAAEHLKALRNAIR